MVFVWLVLLVFFLIRCSNLVLTPLIKVQIWSNYLMCHICNIPITSQNYIIFISALSCWFTVNLQFVTVTASFCTAVAVARSCLFCIYICEFALSTVAFSTCLYWNKSNCFWTCLSVCKGHSKFQSSSLLAWCLQNTWCIFSIISCLELVMKLVMKTMYSTDPWRIFRKIGHWDWHWATGNCSPRIFFLVFCDDSSQNISPFFAYESVM